MQHEQQQQQKQQHATAAAILVASATSATVAAWISVNNVVKAFRCVDKRFRFDALLCGRGRWEQRLRLCDNGRPAQEQAWPLAFLASRWHENGGHWIPVHHAISAGLPPPQAGPAAGRGWGNGRNGGTYAHAHANSRDSTTWSSSHTAGGRRDTHAYDRGTNRGTQYADSSNLSKTKQLECYEKVGKFHLKHLPNTNFSNMTLFLKNRTLKLIYMCQEHT